MSPLAPHIDHPDEPVGLTQRLEMRPLSPRNWPAADALDPLDAAFQLQRWLDTTLDSAVLTARQAGHSWASIGDSLGMSRQAAWQRWGTARP